MDQVFEVKMDINDVISVRFNVKNRKFGLTLLHLIGLRLYKSVIICHCITTKLKVFSPTNMVIL